MVIYNQKYFRYSIVWDKVLKSGFLNAKKAPLRRHEIIGVFFKKRGIYNPQFEKGEPLHSKGKTYKDKEIKNNNYGKFNNIDDKRKGETKKYPSSIIKTTKPHPSIAIHPTQKPVELLETLIKTYSNKGDTVLDFTMGSGTTGVACLKQERDFIGIELDKEYFNIAKKRIEETEREEKHKLF